MTETLTITFAPNGAPVPDLHDKLPGEKEILPCREDALRAWLVERGIAPAPWLERCAVLLRQDALNWLMLANKAGLLLSGFDTLEPALRNGEIAIIIQGSDARPDGIRKLNNAAHAGNMRLNREKEVPAIRVFSSEELGQVLGRNQAVHLGLKNSARAAKNGISLAESFLQSCQRLAGFRGEHGI